MCLKTTKIVMIKELQFRIQIHLQNQERQELE